MNHLFGSAVTHLLGVDPRDQETFTAGYVQALRDTLKYVDDEFHYEARESEIRDYLERSLAEARTYQEELHGPA